MKNKGSTRTKSVPFGEKAEESHKKVSRPTGRTPSSSQAREAQGKSLREKCPRLSHGKVLLGQGERDPLDLLESSSKDRVESLLPVRWGRMMESAFAFFRGSAILQAHDLKGTPTSGLIVRACGDCHLLNFGGFATPERLLAFDVNDFDENFPAPFEWDLKRLTTSIVLAGRWLQFDKGAIGNAVNAAAGAFRKAITTFSRMSILDIYYAKSTVDELLNDYSDVPQVREKLSRSVSAALQNNSEHVFHKVTRMVDGQPRIIDSPPLLFHPDPADLHLELAPFLQNYRESLPADRRVLLDRYRLVDVAFKVVGVGSVGTRSLIVLFLGDQDEPLFLQVKEARASVLEGVAGPSPWSNHGERVITGQRLLQSASDIFLGWSRGIDGRDYYVRQLRDCKIAPELVGMTPRALAAYSELCGRTLARGHSKSGDAASISGYIGTGTKFDKAIQRYAIAYANQVEKDFDTFQLAVKAGRFPTGTLTSEIERAIR